MDCRTSSVGIKMLVVGDANTGKSCLLRQFVHGVFLDDYKRTVGAEFLEKDVVMPHSAAAVRTMLWDTAGSDVFNALTQSYYRGAGAAIVTFSSVDRTSFLNVESWKARVESVCGPITIVLCQTKFDLFQQSAVRNEEAEQLAMRLKIPFFRTSAKDAFNVAPLFEFTVQRCAEMWHAAQAPSPSQWPAASSIPHAYATPGAPLPQVGASAVPPPPPAALATTAGVAPPPGLPATDSGDSGQQETHKKKKSRSKTSGKCLLM